MPVMRSFVFNAGHAQLCVQCRSAQHVHFAVSLAVVLKSMCTCSGALAVVHLQ